MRHKASTAATQGIPTLSSACTPISSLAAIADTIAKNSTTTTTTKSTTSPTTKIATASANKTTITPTTTKAVTISSAPKPNTTITTTTAPTTSTNVIQDESEDDEVEQVQSPSKPPAKAPRRSKNFGWDESYALLKLIKKEGKNWAKILVALHALHKCTWIATDDYDKLRVHFNTLKSEKNALWKPYVQPKYQPDPEDKDSSNEEKALLLQLHASKHETIANEREIARTLIHQIEADERLVHSGDKKSEAQVLKELEEKKDEKRKIRDERLASAEKLVCNARQPASYLAYIPHRQQQKSSIERPWTVAWWR